jgi:SOS response associated peptidase (SRAP)
VEGDQGAEGEAAPCDRHEGRQAVWHWRHLGTSRRPATGEWIRTFAVITTDANELVAGIHDRMPLILAPEDYSTLAR